MSDDFTDVPTFNVFFKWVS